MGWLKFGFDQMEDRTHAGPSKQINKERNKEPSHERRSRCDVKISTVVQGIIYSGAD